MRVLIFGTYDTSTHPRVATIAEGMRARGSDVAECNAPLGFDTAARVDMLAHPWRAPALLARLARRWATLARTARRMPAPDAVVVGYLGHFDIHLARLIFRRVPIVLDHLVGASDTARDRRLDGGPRQALLRMIDSAALRAADVIVVDTDEHLAALPQRHRARAVVVPVPYSHSAQALGWQADTGDPGSLIGGWFMGPDPTGQASVEYFGPHRLTTAVENLDALWGGKSRSVGLSRGQLDADLAYWRPAAVVAVSSPGSRLGQLLTSLFGRPDVQVGGVLAWRR